MKITNITVSNNKSENNKLLHFVLLFGKVLTPSHFIHLVIFLHDQPASILFSILDN